MEEDRLASNLGPDHSDLAGEHDTQPKLPKRRFVGRRAVEAAAQKNGVTGSIEDSGAVQGRCRYPF